MKLPRNKSLVGIFLILLVWVVWSSIKRHQESTPQKIADSDVNPGDCFWSIGKCAEIRHNLNTSYISIERAPSGYSLGWASVNWCGGCSCGPPCNCEEDVIHEFTGLICLPVSDSTITYSLTTQDPDYIGPYSGGPGHGCGGGTASRHHGDTVRGSEILTASGTTLLEGITFPQEPESVPRDHKSGCGGAEYHIDTVLPVAHGYIHRYLISVSAEIPSNTNDDAPTLQVSLTITKPQLDEDVPLCTSLLPPVIHASVQDPRHANHVFSFPRKSGWQSEFYWNGVFEDGTHWGKADDLVISLAGSYLHECYAYHCDCVSSTREIQYEEMLVF